MDDHPCPSCGKDMDFLGGTQNFEEFGCFDCQVFDCIGNLPDGAAELVKRLTPPTSRGGDEMAHVDYYKCDRCGVEGKEKFTFVSADGHRGFRVDLCHQCAAKLERFVSAPPTTSEEE